MGPIAGNQVPVRAVQPGFLLSHDGFASVLGFVHSHVHRYRGGGGLRHMVDSHIKAMICQLVPNEAHSVDAPIAPACHIGHHGRRATDARRSALP